MMRRINNVDLDDFTHHYLVTALWSSTVSLPVPEGELVDGCMDCPDDHPLHDIRDGDPLDDHFDIEDFPAEELRKATEDCDAFQATHDDDLCDEDSETAGHDFWLTRNGHGAGFWDGDYEESKGLRLTEGSKVFGELSIWVDEAGKLHFE